MKAGETKAFLILSPAISGFWTHWNGRVSAPCVEPHDLCPGCKHNQPSRWKGYLHAVDMVTRNECFLELTPTAAEMLSLQIENKDSLRGFRLELKRTTAANGRLRLQLLPKIERLTDLPSAKDPLISLQNLWGLDPVQQA
jgi:hypothetical protein